MPLTDDQTPATKKDLRKISADWEDTKKDLRNVSVDLQQLATSTKKNLQDYAAANKKDLQELERNILAAVRQELHGFTHIIMGTMQNMEDRMLSTMDEKISTSEGRMLVCMEQWRHDVTGTLKDVRSNDIAVADHEQRIGRLERHAGMAA